MCMAPYACLWAVLLGCVHLCSTQPIVVQHNCDLESGLCGWEYYSWNDMRQVGVVQPSNESAPRLGHYYYFYYPHSYEIYTLGFPNDQYICGLSFAYAVDGATTLLLSRLNFDEIEINTTVVEVTPPDVTGPWQKAYHYITLPPVTKIYPLYFRELVADMGEAAPANEEMFLALDDLNITFCLPCNFDNLTTFIYTIESVFPTQLMPIFSLDPYSGLLSVNDTKIILDANGTIGNITISAYVLGSNYTNLSPAFKVYRTATFRQDQTIAVLSPPTINVMVGVPFSFHINATSPLDYTMPLTYLLLSSQTMALSGYVTIEPRLGDVQGLITVQQLASVLSPSKSPPSLTFSIVNQYGSNVIWTVTLEFACSPPLFTQQSYSFYVQPNSGVIPIGTLSIVDPHQRELQTPSLSFSNASDSSLFQLLCIESFDCALLWIQSRSNQYRANYTFAIVTYPVASPSLRASANIFNGQDDLDEEWAELDTQTFAMEPPKDSASSPSSAESGELAQDGAAIGDKVDARHLSMGAWLKAKVVKVMKEETPLTPDEATCSSSSFVPVMKKKLESSHNKYMQCMTRQRKEGYGRIHCNHDLMLVCNAALPVTLEKAIYLSALQLHIEQMAVE
ncbi:hypothetical protein EMCRGX_G011191 [Ephydatia muelleri]